MNACRCVLTVLIIASPILQNLESRAKEYILRSNQLTSFWGSRGEEPPSPEQNSFLPSLVAYMFRPLRARRARATVFLKRPECRKRNGIPVSARAMHFKNRSGLKVFKATEKDFPGRWCLLVRINGRDSITIYPARFVLKVTLFCWSFKQGCLFVFLRRPRKSFPGRWCLLVRTNGRDSIAIYPVRLVLKATLFCWSIKQGCEGPESEG